MNFDKKTLSTVKALAFALCAALAFSACKNEPIFATIEKETELSKPNIEGNVWSMVPLAGQLYVQNGYIYTKAPGTPRGWKKIATPQGAGPIIRLASDATNLYAMDQGFNVWAVVPASTTTASDWAKVYDNTDGAEVFLFDNQVYDTTACTTAGREAYIRTSGGVLNLKGATPVDGSTTFVTIGGATKESKTCVCVGGADYFSGKAILATDGTNLFSSAKDFWNPVYGNASSTLVYRAPNESDSAWNNSIAVSNYISSIAYDQATDKLLVGTYKNYVSVTVGDNHIPSGSSPAGDNATSAFGSRIVEGIWSYGGVQYASVCDINYSTYSKLWANYNGVWDYE